MTGVPLGGAATGLGVDATLSIERTTTGAVRVTCATAPGWAKVARTPLELARALADGWNEASVAAYATRRAEPYDVALHDNAAEEVSRAGRLLPVDADERAGMMTSLACTAQPSATGRATAPTYDPMMWSQMPDGRWVSPAGRKYGPSTQVARRIMAKRAEAGIDTPADLPSRGLFAS